MSVKTKEIGCLVDTACFLKGMLTSIFAKDISPWECQSFPASFETGPFFTCMTLLRSPWSSYCHVKEWALRRTYFKNHISHHLGKKRENLSIYPEHGREYSSGILWQIETVPCSDHPMFTNEGSTTYIVMLHVRIGTTVCHLDLYLPGELEVDVN